MGIVFDDSNSMGFFVDRVVGVKKKDNYRGKDDYIWDGKACIGSVWTILLVLDTGVEIPVERIRVIPQALISKIDGFSKTYVDEKFGYWLDRLSKLRKENNV